MRKVELSAVTRFLTVVRQEVNSLESSVVVHVLELAIHRFIWAFMKPR